MEAARLECLEFESFPAFSRLQADNRARRVEESLAGWFPQAFAVPP